MSAAHALYYADGTTLVHRAVNTVLSPVSAAERLMNGRDVPDDYTIALSAVSNGVSATATISAARGTLNSQHGRVVSVPLTGAWVEDVVRGWRFQFATSGLDATARAVVYNGLNPPAIDAGNPLGIRYDWSLSYDDPGLVTGLSPGTEPFLVGLWIKNISGELWQESKWVIRRHVTYKPTAGAGLASVANLGTPTEKAEVGGGKKTLPYLVTFAGLDTAANPDEINVRFDGEAVTVQDVTHGGSPVTSDQLLADGSTVYQITAGPTTGSLAGVQFVLPTNVANSDTGELYVKDPGPVSIAPDAGATPGAWVSGNGASVTLTQVGESAGQVENAASVLVWLKRGAPAGSPWAKNPWQFMPVVEARLAGATGE